MSKVVWTAEKGWHDDGQNAQVINDNGRLVIIPDREIRPGVFSCHKCGRAYSVRPFPSTGDYYDGERVRAVGVCSICDGATIALNCVIIHAEHQCDTHAPSVIDAVTRRPL